MSFRTNTYCIKNQTNEKIRKIEKKNKKSLKNYKKYKNATATDQRTETELND